MKILRWLISTLVALFALLVIAIILLVNFINPNDYREQINHAISEKIHKPFAINGEINWVFFPSLGFKAQNMTVGDRNTHDLYVSLHALEINLQLMPLLHKNIVLNALHIDGAEIILPADQSAAATQPTSENNNSIGNVFALPGLSLKAFSIKNATIIKQKNNGTPLWQMKNFSEEASDISLGQSFPEESNFIFSYPEKNISAKINFKADVNIDAQAQMIRLISPTLMVDNNGALSAEGQLSMKQLSIDLAKQNISIEKFSGDVNQIKFSGQATVDHFLDNPIVRGNILLSSNRLREALSKFHITLPVMQSTTALSKFLLETNFQYGNNQLNATPLKLQLDQATMQGSIKSNDLKNLALELDLTTPHFNLSDYLKADGTTDPKQIDLSSGHMHFKLLPQTGTDSDWLAAMLSGSLTMAECTISGQSLANVSLLLDAKNKIFKIIKLHSEIWQGAIDGSGIVNLQGNAPQFNLNPQIKNIEIKNLIALLEPKLKLSGLANVMGNLSFEGGSLDAIKQNLTGRLNVLVKNGVLQGVDIAYWINAGHNILHEMPMPEKSNNPQTDFGTLTATFLINQGVANNSDLLLVGPTLYVKGQGSIDLPRESLNYHLLIAKTNEDTGDAQNDTIPLLIAGNFDHPSIALDMATLTKRLLNKEVTQQKDKLLQKALGSDLAQSPVGQQLGQALGNLFH